MQVNKLRLLDSASGVISGRLATLQIALDIELYQNDDWDRSRPESPAYDVFAKGRSGGVKVGAAWVKRAERGRNAGQEFLTLTVDDPSFPAPLNMTAFPSGEAGEWEVVWRRPRQRDAGADMMPAPAGNDDPIPY